MNGSIIFDWLAVPTVGFERTSSSITEGETLQVCLELTDVPSGGLGCNISVYLSTTFYAGKEGQSKSMYVSSYDNTLCPIAALEGEDFTVLNSEVVFGTSSISGDVECVDFADIIEDMTLEGSHEFVVNIDSTSPEINIDGGAEYLSVYIIDNDSELATSLSACHGHIMSFSILSDIS